MELPYDGVDNDCDAATKDDDLDNDGVPKASDCNDNEAAVSSTIVGYADDDSDGFGAGPAVSLCATTPPPGYAATDQDCAPGDPAVHATIPGYRDNDGDGIAGTLENVCALSLPGGFSATGPDCNDTDPSVGTGSSYYDWPDDGIDQDCVGGDVKVLSLANVVFVDKGAASCADGGPGTAGAPKCTIGAAITSAPTGATVAVAANASSYNEALDIQKDLAIIGGYTPNFVSHSRIASTTIGVLGAGPLTAAGAARIRVGDAAVANVQAHLGNFNATMASPAGQVLAIDHGAAAYLRELTLTVGGNGNASATTVLGGAYLDATDCAFYGSTAGNSGGGATVFLSQAEATIARSRIFGGHVLMNKSASALSLVNASVAFVMSSLLVAPTITAPATSHAVSSASESKLHAANNTIVGVAGTEPIVRLYDGENRVVSNIFHATDVNTRGIEVGDTTGNGAPLLLETNLFSLAGTQILRSIHPPSSPVYVTTSADLNACASVWDLCATSAGNIVAPATFAETTNYTLALGSPAIDAGLDAATRFVTSGLHRRDLLGKFRPANAIDIGATER